MGCARFFGSDDAGSVAGAAAVVANAAGDAIAAADGSGATPRLRLSIEGGMGMLVVHAGILAFLLSGRIA